MAAFLEICRDYPLSSLLLVFGPFIGAILTAASGYEGLKARLSTDQQAIRIEASVASLASPVETVRRYQAMLGGQGQRSDILANIVDRYDGAKQMIGQRLTGKADTADRIGSAERAVADLQNALQGVTTTTLVGREALILKIAPNTFRVTFSAPVQAVPRLAFHDLPSGAAAHVLDPSKFGLMVVFSPSDIAVEHFGIAADDSR